MEDEGEGAGRRQGECSEWDAGSNTCGGCKIE